MCRLQLRQLHDVKGYQQHEAHCWPLEAGTLCLKLISMLSKTVLELITGLRLYCSGCSDAWHQPAHP